MFPGFDPSKMDPKLLMELSNVIRELPPDQLNRMQSMMHNMMAGFDVSQEMAAFERDLPPGFREKVARLMMSQGAAGFAPTASAAPAAAPAADASQMGMHEARITILRAVAEGKVSPEDAERLLFG